MRRVSVILPLMLLVLLPSCQRDGKGTGAAYLTLASFENQDKSLAISPLDESVGLAIVDNPVTSKLDTSAKCAEITLGSSGQGSVRTEAYGRNFDFTLNPPVFRLKVIAPSKGSRIGLSIEQHNPEGQYPIVGPVWASSRKSGAWEELEFDLSALSPEDNIYSKVVLSFEADPGEKWYFDDIQAPDDDLSSISLFKRYEGNPVFYPEGSGNWRDAHIANAGILSPSQTPTGKWMMYIRGTGHTPDYHDQIGLFTQEADSFNPFGPWKEYEGNPVIPYSAKGAFDDYLLLDTAPVMGADSVMYVYYKGRNYDMNSHIGVAWSTDGGYTFSKPGHPWREKPAGTCCAIYHDGKYYLFCGSIVYISDDPLDGNNAEIRPTIKPGGAPSHFDDRILWGTMVFRLEGVDKWFMAYQGSSRHIDFPDRFHIAMSDDLVSWEKVQNRQPLFTRGAAGEWDQGGMWCPEIEEFEGNLYLYYEGWGIDKRVRDRNENYFEGHSSVGVASCSKDDFLRWCGLL